MTISKAALLFGMQALAVKEWRVDENADVKVHIKGRKAGLISWFLNFLKIDATTILELRSNQVSLSDGSIAGQIKEIVPLTGTCNLGTGYLKPFGYIIAAIGCFLWALYGMASDNVSGFWVLLQICAAIGFVAAYFLNKCMIIYVTPDSGSSIMIAFKRSLIEGVDVDENAAAKVIKLMSDSAIHATSKSTPMIEYNS